MLLHRTCPKGTDIFETGSQEKNIPKPIEIRVS
jgi:hypothetical protein